MTNNHGSPALPTGLELARTTDVFDNDSVPPGLLRAHRVASGVWARLVVRTGSIKFVFEDEPERALNVAAGESVVIPPGRLHHVELDAPATFVIEFHRMPGDSAVGLETSGLAPRSALDSH